MHKLVYLKGKQASFSSSSITMFITWRRKGASSRANLATRTYRTSKTTMDQITI